MPRQSGNVDFWKLPLDRAYIQLLIPLAPVCYQLADPTSRVLLRRRRRLPPASAGPGVAEEAGLPVQLQGRH